VFILDRQVNQAFLLNMSVNLKIIEIQTDYVMFHSIATNGEEVFPEDLLFKHFQGKITTNDFLFEKRVADKKIILRLNESLLMGQDGCVRVLQIDENSVKLALNFPKHIEILKQENIKARVYERRSSC
jgi:carbon storage regulator CsrA